MDDAGACAPEVSPNITASAEKISTFGGNPETEHAVGSATVTGRRDEDGGPQVGLSKGKQRTDPQTCNQPHVSAKASAYTSSKVSGVNSGQMRFSVMEELVGEDNMSETFEMLKNKIRSITGPRGHPHGKASKPVNKGRKG